MMIRRFRPDLESLEDRCVPSASGLEPVKGLTVMSRNLYAGTELEPVIGAVSTGDPTAIVTAVSQAWANVGATNFPERAEALADEIEAAQPHLIGLQEVALFRTGVPDSAIGNPTKADHVELDYLDILVDELASRGLNYEAVVVTEQFDAEFPGLTANGLQDIRLTDRDVILARTDLPRGQFKIVDVQEGNFATNVQVPLGGGQTFEILRGWNAVDVKVNGTKVRFINAHLEAENANPLINAVQAAQAQELLDGPANFSKRVILAGDFNSRADGTGTTSYSQFIGAGFVDAWSTTHPNEVGNTWGHDSDLLNTTVNLTQRLDLVLTRGKLRARSADIVGEELNDRTASGLWPSDHAGIAVNIGLHPGWRDAETALRFAAAAFKR